MAMNTNTERDQEFDNAMRRLHADALAQVSAPTRARLRDARASASTAGGSRRGFGWALASGFAAIFALAIGWQLQSPPAATTDTVTVDDAIDAAMYDTDTAVAALDENPDFYLWLASNDDAMPTVTEH